MLYIKENSRELIEEYMDDITYLDQLLWTVNINISSIASIDAMIEFEELSVETKEALTQLRNDTEYNAIYTTERLMTEHFEGSKQPMYIFEALNINDLKDNINQTISALNNRIMGILKRSR